MPNKNSHAYHNPIRTCVVCKKKVDQKGLLNFFIMNGGIVFDSLRIVAVRKNYLCPSQECFTGLDKWRKRYQKRHKAH
ncbi:MAG: DUF448 domain-containing protein [Candidatus Cloacimonetes bacterium HGW-Cloacimonetes-3]|jgi:predicted RNA-binding protein YlxR (DUF448 family)|nr:MAG: DUF448 domain-containing protein [Candidatus Cloacimonetes bacterium HGW-Cloacimonetes-3]